MEKDILFADKTKTIQQLILFIYYCVPKISNPVAATRRKRLMLNTITRSYCFDSRFVVSIEPPPSQASFFNFR